MSDSKNGPFKMVIVGDGACGKTSMLSVYRHGYYDRDCLPSVYMECTSDVTVDGKQVRLELCDTAGQEDYESLRMEAYPGSHIVLICFAVNCSDSLANVEDKWIHEVTRFCPGVPIIVVGCKKDLRYDSREIEYLKREGQRFVTPEEGTAIARKIGAAHYLECTADMNDGVDEVFQTSASTVLRARRKHRNLRKILRCVVM